MNAHNGKISNKMMMLPHRRRRAQEPFDLAKCKRALEGDSKTYRASLNFWAIDVTRVGNPHVPLMSNSVTKFREHHFKTPALPPCDVVVAVESPEAVMACIESRSLRQVSAPESLFAYIMAVWEDLKKNDDGLNAKWRATMLCCPVIFRVVPLDGDLFHRLTVQYREDMAQNFASLRYSAVQKMFDVKATVDRKAGTTGLMSAAKVAAYYQEGVKFAEGSEAISDEFVDCSLSVLKRLWCIPRAAELIMQLEEHGVGNPMDSIYKLHKARLGGGGGGGAAPPLPAAAACCRPRRPPPPAVRS